MDIHINITIPQAASALPAGYRLARIRKHGDPQMVKNGYDINQLYPDGSIIATFQATGVYTPPVLDWSAVTKFNRLTASDMYRIAKAQLKAFGVPHDDPLRQMDVVLSDGYTLRQKMGWMYQNRSAGSPATLVMWGEGEWWEDGQKCYGTMVSGGNLVAVSDMLYTFNIRMPQEIYKRDVIMRRLLSFRRADLDADPLERPHLWEKATCVYKDNRFSEFTPKGIIYLPVALDARDFPMNTTVQPEAYYLPTEWME